MLSLMLPYRSYGKICDTELSNIMGMKYSGVCHFVYIDPSLACLIQSSSLQANQGSTEESKGTVNGSFTSCVSNFPGMCRIN